MVECAAAILIFRCRQLNVCSGILSVVSNKNLSQEQLRELYVISKQIGKGWLVFSLFLPVDRLEHGC